MIFLILVLVSAWSDSILQSGVNPVPFEKVEVNIGNMWNNNTHNFTMTASQGIFYVAMAAGSYFQKPLDFLLQKSNHPFASCSDSHIASAHYEVMGRDIILKLNSAETLHYSSSSGYFSNWQLQTSIGIFSIPGQIMSSDVDPVVFSVARNSSLSEIMNPVPFNQILVNDYSHYDVSTNKFTALSSGIYFFTFSVGAEAFMPVKLVLYVNDVPFTSIIRESTSHNGTDVIGRSIMMLLEMSDTVHVAKEDDGSWYSDLLETSFTGFKYDPPDGNKVRGELM